MAVKKAAASRSLASSLNRKLGGGMNRAFSRSARASVISYAIFALGGCGGGTPPCDVNDVASVCTSGVANANLKGAYKLVGYAFGPGGQGGGDSGDLHAASFDGAGNFSDAEVQNAFGAISSRTVSGTYTAAADGTLSISQPEGEFAVTTFSGALGTSGNMFVASQTSSDPRVLVGIKQGQGDFSNGNLTGTYTVVRYDWGGGTGDSAGLSTVTFDGAGNFSGTDTLNNAGQVSTMAVSGTYTVAADGTLTLSPVGGSPVTGGLSADGNSLVASQINPGALPEILVGIKRSQMNYSNTNLRGTYAVADYTYVDNSYICCNGTFGDDSVGLSKMTFDGAGNFSGAKVLNDADGTVSNLVIAGTYAVAADGTLTLSPVDGPVVTGSLTADGSTLVIAEITSGSAPSVAFGVRP